MYTGGGIFGILCIIIVISFISYAVLFMVNVSSLKVMLLGIALIVFSSSVLKGMIKYGMDAIVSIIGLSFCIAGFIKKDNEK